MAEVIELNPKIPIFTRFVRNDAPIWTLGNGSRKIIVSQPRKKPILKESHRKRGNRADNQKSYLSAFATLDRFPNFFYKPFSHWRNASLFWSRESMPG